MKHKLNKTIKLADMRLKRAVMNPKSKVFNERLRKVIKTGY